MLLAEVHVGGAGALHQGPAEAATLLFGADHGSPNGGDPKWLLEHEPGGQQDQLTRFRSEVKTPPAEKRGRTGKWSTYLCYLSKGVGGWDALVTMDAVPWNGVRTLWRRVARRHVGWGGCRQGA